MDRAAINNIQEPITSASSEVRQIIERVLELEKEKLYQKNFKHINEDILKIIKQAVDETDINTTV